MHHCFLFFISTERFSLYLYPSTLLTENEPAMQWPPCQQHSLTYPRHKLGNCGCYQWLLLVNFDISTCHLPQDRWATWGMEAPEGNQRNCRERCSNFLSSFVISFIILVLLDMILNVDLVNQVCWWMLDHYNHFEVSDNTLMIKFPIHLSMIWRKL